MASNLVPNCDVQLRLKSVFECDLIKDYSNRVPLAQLAYGGTFSDMLGKKLQDINSQTVTAKLISKNHYAASDVSDGCEATPCSGGLAPKGNTSNTVSLSVCDNDYSGSISVSFSLADYRALVQNASNPSSIDAPLNPSPEGNAWEQEIWSMQEALELAMEDKLATQLVASVNGTSYGFSADEALTFTTPHFAKKVKTFGATPSGFNVKGDLLSEVGYSADAANFCSSPLIVGAKPVWEYMKQMDSGCCADNGIDIGSYMDKHPATFVNSLALAKEFSTVYTATLTAGTETGVNCPYFLSLEKGAIQVLNYQQYSGGVFSLDFETHKKFTYRSPVTGRFIDMSVYIDTCAGTVIVSLTCNEKLYTLPEQFGSGDYRYRVNGIQQFKVVNA